VAADARLIREDSHRGTNPATEKAQLVEFLDFECESCRAAEPLVEEPETEYGDRITFVHRYFPLPGHAQFFLRVKKAHPEQRSPVPAAPRRGRALKS
jgi:thiol-disulfide isomerase/thioredoxin